MRVRRLTAGPLNLGSVRQTGPANLQASKPDMWRYGPVLPVQHLASVVTLGEGMTPLLPVERLGRAVGAERLWVKDDGLNPTGPFKARGMSCGIPWLRLGHY